VSGSQWKVAPPDTFGCVLWLGKTTKDGYPIVYGSGGGLAHRIALVQAGEDLEHGLEVDHMCRRRLCVRVEHLEAVTRQENELRKSWRYRARRTHCRRGHELASAIITPEGGRICRTCNQEGRKR
jgi:hypothetical protein